MCAEGSGVIQKDVLVTIIAATPPPSPPPGPGPKPGPGPGPKPGPGPAPVGSASVLKVVCGETQNVLTWTMPAGANSNSINKRTDGGSTVQIPTTGKSYTDTAVSPGHTYDYRHKAFAGVASNVVTCPDSAPPPKPTADIKVNGSNGPITVSSGASVTLTWNSTNLIFCSVDPGGYWGPTGNEIAEDITSSVTYTLTCSGGGNEATDSVTVNVAGTPPPPPIPPPQANPTFAIEPSVRTLGVGGTSLFKATYDFDGSGPQAEQDVSADAVWESSNSGVAEDLGGGRFFAERAGESAIRAIYRGLTVTATLKVIQGGVKPLARTTGATNIRTTYANLGGLVNPNGAATMAWFEYGRTASLGNTTKKKALGTNRAWIAANEDVFLRSGAEYFYRVVAQNAFGASYGETQKLTAAGNPELVIEPRNMETDADKTASFAAWYDPDGAGPQAWRNVTGDVIWLSSATNVASHESSGVFRGIVAGEATVAVVYNAAGPVTNINEISNVSAEGVLAVNQPETESVATVELAPPEEPTSTPPIVISPWQGIATIFGFVALIAVIGAGTWYVKGKISGGY